MWQYHARLLAGLLLAALIGSFTGSPALSEPVQSDAPVTVPGEKQMQPSQFMNGVMNGANFRISPGSMFRDCLDCPEMVVIAPGQFNMGSPEKEQGHNPDEEPQHQVSIAREFAIGRYEITFKEWDACVSANACDHIPHDEDWGRDNRPVINVSWHDAQEYVQWLSEKTGEKYRLPSESEWEYAARAGTTTARFWKDRQLACPFANVYDLTARRVHKLEWQNFNCADGAQSTAPVGGYLANDFGLHDMLGNVWEWVSDCWTPNYVDAPADGAARTDGDCRRRVMRGGSWQNVDWATRSSFRGWNGAMGRTNHIGFRIARSSS